MRVCRWVLLGCLSLLSVLPAVGFALDLELTEGVNKAFPMGIDGFGDTKEARELTKIIAHDLRFSGQFKLIKAPRVADGKPSLRLWQQVGADSVLSGTMTPREDGQYAVHVELFDVAARGRSLILKDYDVMPGDLRRFAHHISDEVYQTLTGVRGVFSTRLAYVLVNREEGEKPTYSLVVSDMDGYNPHALLTSKDPLMSPAWSPNGRELAYVSFEKRRAQVFVVNVETGKRRLITDFDGINGAPAWSPDGRELVVVLSKSGSPKLYSVSLVTGRMKQLTYGSAIDTEPRFSSDGESLLFTSGRGGAPQVYRLSLADGSVHRMTFEGNYNARPSYTPDGRHLVVLHREDKRFNIAAQDIDTGRFTILTDSDADESPSVAPNGRFVVYATQDKKHGVLAIVSLDGRVNVTLPTREGDVQEPAWSPFVG